MLTSGEMEFKMIVRLNTWSIINSTVSVDMRWRRWMFSEYIKLEAMSLLTARARRFLKMRKCYEDSSNSRLHKMVTRAHATGYQIKLRYGTVRYGSWP